jgi:hypothetical protein
VAGAPRNANTVDARRLLALSRSLHPGQSWMSLAQTIYVTVIALGIVGILFRGLWNQFGSFFSDLASPYSIVWGAPAIALVLVAALRYSTLQGFASYSEPDCVVLLSAPVLRSGLVRPRLRRASLTMGLGGALIAVLAGVASGGGSRSAGRLLEEAVAGFALGALIVSLGWNVQRLRGASQWVLRSTLPALAVVALLAFADRHGGILYKVALWSGPWGWGLLFLGANWASGVAGLALLGALTLAGWISVRHTAGAASLESFLVRARTRSQVVAGLYAFDTRSVALAGRQPHAERWRARLRLRVPERAVLAVPWHAALVLLRSPMRLGWAIVLSGMGTLLVAVHPGRTGTSWAGALLLYLSASSLMEPLRLEVDSSAASGVLLPWRYGDTLWLHCPLPAGVLLTVGFISTMIAWATGFVSSATIGTLAIIGIPLAFIVVLAAALSARRGGRLSNNMMLLTAGDSMGFSVFLIVGWIFGWAILGIAAVAISVRLLRGPGVLLGATVFVAVGTAVLALIMWRVLKASKR